MKSSGTIPIAIIVGGMLVAAAIYLSLAPSRSSAPVGDPASVRPVSENDHILGNPAARVMIIEYSDFACEFCKTFHETMHQLIANEGATGDIAWVFRHFPLHEIHPTALAHARAAECAATVADTATFWKFADALYARQPVDPGSYGTLANAVGISSDAFATCYATASPERDARIEADRQNALDMGAKGTPYSIILVPGKAPVVVDGAYSYDDLKLLITQVLGQ